MAQRKRKTISELARREQPMNWRRAFLSGSLSAAILVAFLDIFSVLGDMLGFSGISLEVYLGSLVRGHAYGVHVWTLGLISNLIVGGIFGLVYGYFFEYVFRRSDARVGTALGLAHAILAAVAFFPFFGMLHEQIGTGVRFGFFGSELGPLVPILLLFGHLIFGASMGLFYGPVRAARVHGRVFEPGQGGLPGEPGVILPQDDPRDSAFV